MLYEIPRFPPKEKAILVGLATESQRRAEVEDHLIELARLADTAGAEVLETVIQSRPHIDPSFFIGKGKIFEIRDKLQAQNGNVVIFDDELSAGQVRNIQDVVQVKVIDRTNLILDIFARHARTRGARIQVELAQLQYLLPRLKSAWTHFGQQTGAGARRGIGTRGPGETQLETDRRTVQKRISELRDKLQKIDQIRMEQGKQRRRLPQVCLVGYTNAGKSSLMNALAKEKVKVQDELFSTLDTTTRKFYLENTGTVLLSDTVGFIRKLPAHLIESFHSTLTVAREADLLLHVVDASAEDLESHIEVVEDTLRRLQADAVPRILVFNKIDLCRTEGRLLQLSRMVPDAYFISTLTGDGIPGLKIAIAKALPQKELAAVPSISI